MEIKNRPLLALAGVAVVGVLAALILFALAYANIGATLDVMTGERSGGVPAWVAFIPLTIGVAAGIGAAVVWANAPSRR